MNSAALVIQTAFLGDVVLTTPLLEALGRRHGPVDIVTTPAAAPLVETHPAVRRVIPYDKRGRDRGWRGLRTLARALRAERYAVAYIPHGSLRSAALALLARIPRRVGLRGAWSLFYTDTRSPPPPPPPHLARARRSAGPSGPAEPVALRPPFAVHQIDRLLALAHDGVATPDTTPRPRLYPNALDRQAALALLGEHGIRGDFVALAPGSIWATKRWPYYGRLARWLAGRGVPVVVLGGPEDRPLGDEIVAAVGAGGGRAANACGRLSLRQSAALIGHSRLLVTNDSAPLHFASAMGTRTVAIFGPTIPEFGFGPVGDRDVAVGMRGLPCRPCSRHGPRRCPLGHHRCMTELAADRVAAAIEETGCVT